MLGETLRRAWALGAGPGADQVVIDVDSTICEVCGKAKHGAGYGYSKVLGYHPLIAIMAFTGEVLHVRMRKGAANTQRGAERFVEELVARVRRAGATGELIMRFDSGFWSNATLATLERLDVGYTMGVRMIKAVTRAVEAIEESAWMPIDYTVDGEAEVAECIYKGRRLIVRRTRLTGRQATLWPQWRHFAFVTDLAGDAVEVDAFHRAHATVELGIRDLKEGCGSRARSLGALLRQLGVAPVRRSGPRPHPLDGHARRHHPRGPPHRGPHRAHPVPVDPRLSSQSVGATDAANTTRMAVGRRLSPGPRPSACPAAGSRVAEPPRPAHRR